MQGSWKCKQATAKERRSVWNGGNLSHMQELWDNCWPKLGYSCCITIRGFFGVVWRGFVFWWPWFLCGCFFFPETFHYVSSYLFYWPLRVMARSFFISELQYGMRERHAELITALHCGCVRARWVSIYPHVLHGGLRGTSIRTFISVTRNPRRCSLEWTLVRTTIFFFLSTNW